MNRSSRSGLRTTVAAAVRRCLLGLPFAATVTLYAPGAIAQEDATLGLEEVVVTARYREEKLQETPLAITALSSEALEARSFDNVSEIGAAIPNAFIRDSHPAYGGSPVIRIRNVGQIESLFAFEPGVGVYIDDVYHSTLLGSSFDLMDLEQIEVLRGPQGTLFGKNSLGGAIRLRSKKPGPEREGSLEVSYGARDRLDFKGSFNTPLIDDKLFLRVAGVSKRQDGYQDVIDFTCQMVANGTPQLAGIGDGLGADGSAGGGLNGQPDVVPVGSAADNALSFPYISAGAHNGDCNVGTFGGTKLQAGRAMLRYLATDRLELNLSADYTDQDDEAPPIAARYVATNVAAWNNNKLFPAFGVRLDNRFILDDPYKTYYQTVDVFTGEEWPQGYESQAWGVSLNADYRITDAVGLKVITSYRGYDSVNANNRFAVPLPLNLVSNVNEHRQKSAEVQLFGTLAGSFDWTTGAFWFKGDEYYGGRVVLDSTNFLGVLPVFNNNDNFDTENKSAFVHGVYRMTDALSLTAGLRYTDEKKGFLFDHRPNLPVSGPAIDASTSFDRFDWKVGADYKLADGLFTYAQVATGFRSPGFNPRPFNATQLIAFSEEELTSYEIGFKGDMLDRRLRTNLAVFYSDYDKWVRPAQGIQCSAADVYSDPVVGVPTCPAGTPAAGTPGIPWSLFIVSTAKSYGAELEVTANPVDNFTIDASVGYNKLEGGQKDPTKPDFVHSSAVLSPELNGSLGLQYRLPLGAAGTITPRVDYFYMGEQTFGAANRQQTPEEVLPSQSLINARVTFENAERDWSVALSGTNLTDKFYWVGLVGALPTAGGGQSGLPSRPREWAITVTHHF